MVFADDMNDLSTPSDVVKVSDDIEDGYEDVPEEICEEENDGIDDLDKDILIEEEPELEEKTEIELEDEPEEDLISTPECGEDDIEDVLDENVTTPSEIDVEEIDEMLEEKMEGGCEEKTEDELEEEPEEDVATSSDAEDILDFEYDEDELEVPFVGVAPLLGDPDIYIITLNNNGAFIPGTDEIYVKYGVGIYSDYGCANETNAISIPRKSGYAFLGYYDETFSVQYITQDGLINSDNFTSTTFNTSVEIKANWVEMGAGRGDAGRETRGGDTGGGGRSVGGGGTQSPIILDEEEAYFRANYCPPGNWIYESWIDKWVYNSNLGLIKSTWAYLYNPYAKDKVYNYAWFNFDENGYMRTGLYQDKNGYSFYLQPNYNNSGTLGMMMTGNIEINGNYFYFGRMTREMLEGTRASKNDGWVYLKQYDKWQYYHNGSPYVSKWVKLYNKDAKEIDDAYTWFNFDESGYARTGFYIEGAGVYYFSPYENKNKHVGYMLMGNQIINGNQLYFEDADEATLGRIVPEKSFKNIK